MKKITRKVILALCLTLAVVFLLSACGGAEYKVTFNDNYEGAGDSFVRTVKSGEVTHSRRPSSSPTGYTFADDWCTDTAGTKTFDFSTPINEDTVLYAKWEINVYTITWNLNYTGNPGNITTQAEHFSKLTPMSPAPTRTGYTFNGWRTGTGGTAALYDFETVITGTRTLYASWTASA